MPSVCFYFQVHQPYRLANHLSFDPKTVRLESFFDKGKNAQIMQKVAKKCYLPTNALIGDLIERMKGAFRVSYSITGAAIDQMREYAPEVIDSFKALAKTGCVEFLGETYYHSLSAVYHPKEFSHQVGMHRDLMQELFGIKPAVFRNTELIYDDRIGNMAADLGYKGVIAEGADDILGWRNSNFVYQVPQRETKLLLKNYKLSDDIAFRFSNRYWAGYPLTADKFAHWAHAMSGNGETLNLFMDYETFGEHQWESTGIFKFLEHLPEAILTHPDWDFKTPSEVIAAYRPIAELSFPRLTSWADADRDLTAWNGNLMQQSTLRQIYEIGEFVMKTGDQEILSTWRKLQTSDHFYYMCTKFFSDGDVHAYFSPYQNPYEAFMNFVNALAEFRLEVMSKI